MPARASEIFRYHIVFNRASYASTVLAVILCLSVRHKSELYKDG